MRRTAALALLLYCQPCFSFVSSPAAALAPRSLLPQGRARARLAALRLEMGARAWFKRKAASLTSSALLSLAVASPVAPARAALVQWDSQNEVLML
jgi:hypothetical protein